MNAGDLRGRGIFMEIELTCFAKPTASKRGI